ncbi:hypothetical protein [Pseudomonas izuensis]|uniref:hypothetical protein n=1 Tax=Pseudomonas izuensis TaxID=2684212 RepID=UPI00135A4D30|nr:hypothetical protein [Pseudomonas izuensis]
MTDHLFSVWQSIEARAKERRNDVAALTFFRHCEIALLLTTRLHSTDQSFEFALTTNCIGFDQHASWQ